MFLKEMTNGNMSKKLDKISENSSKKIASTRLSSSGPPTLKDSVFWKKEFTILLKMLLRLFKEITKKFLPVPFMP